ncbi:MAG: PEP-CTERM sorting domain-containing protein [Deltaproteobacteria bacterium]|nr:PEP-CTERM sorting domain-containing protein [Deltaproteobacteria bacterium]
MRILALALYSVALLALSAPPAGATLFDVLGTFSGSGFTDLGGSELPPVTAVSGTFRFLYDDSQALQSGQLAIAPLAASASVGSAVFDETNTEVRLFFTRGTLHQIFWGGLEGGQANIIPIGTDDIAVGYLAATLFNVTYTQTDSPGRFRANVNTQSGSLSFQMVPEPSTALLLGSSLLALGMRRRTKQHEKEDSFRAVLGWVLAFHRQVLLLRQFGKPTAAGTEIGEMRGIAPEELPLAVSFHSVLRIHHCRFFRPPRSPHREVKRGRSRIAPAAVVIAAGGREESR